jgi:replicative superfamily II helicase
LVAGIFSALKDSLCIETHLAENGETYVMPTELGFIASSYYLKHTTVKKFSDSIKPGMEFKDLMRLMSDADEFKETPLRHN